MRRSVLVLGFVIAGIPLAVAHAQSQQQAQGGSATTTASATAAPTATGTDTSANPSMTSESDGSGSNLTGYGYSDHTARPPVTRAPPPVRGGLQVRSGAAHHPVVPASAGPVATLPGFEMLAEGGSRLFVELSQTVPIDERRARGSLTYVIHGAHVTVHNNTNPLVTVHFNTPVANARLVQAGHDLLFVVALRADAAPTWKVNPGKEGSSVLTVDFPKGSYISQAH